MIIRTPQNPILIIKSATLLRVKDIWFPYHGNFYSNRYSGSEDAQNRLAGATYGLGYDSLVQNSTLRNLSNLTEFE